MIPRQSDTNSRKISYSRNFLRISMIGDSFQYYINLRLSARRVFGFLGFWVFGFWVLGFGFWVWGLGFGVSGFGFRVSGFGFRVCGLGLRVWGLGSGV